jgi:predicted RNase H-like HicB family nuclease
MEYLVIIEMSQTGFGAHVPDLPGCVAVGNSREEVMALLREAMELRLQAMRESGEPIPPPASRSEMIRVQAA